MVGLFFLGIALAVGWALFWRIPHCKHPMSSLDILITPSVSLIIPARNESQNLKRLLHSLATQTQKPTEIIVVDDASEDDTAHVAKQHGAQVSNGDILFFLDADTWFLPNGWKTLMATYAQHKGIMTLQPYHIYAKAYEALNAFFQVCVVGASQMGALWANYVTQKSLFGPAVLIHKQDYIALGGHASVKEHILEHLFLSRLCHQKKIPIFCYGGYKTLAFRMYPHSLRDMIAGWRKSITSGAIQTPPIILGLQIFLLVGYTETVRQGLTALWHMQHGMAITLGGVYVCYALLLRHILTSIGKFSWRCWLFYPIPLFFFYGIFFGSILCSLLRHPITWKSRKIGT